MKFTPIIDKHVVAHDASKKIHVTFDKDETDQSVIATTTLEMKKRTHPAHDKKDEKKAKKAKKDKSEKKTNSEKKEKKAKDTIEPKKKETEVAATATSIKTEIPKPVAVPIITATATTLEKQKKKGTKEKEPVTTPSGPEKPRGPKFTPKKIRKPTLTPKPKLTDEEIKAKVAAIRAKKNLRRKSRGTVDGQTIHKPIFQILPAGLTKTVPTKQLGEFILYALSETTNLGWCNLINKSQVNNMVFIYAQGLNCTYFGVDFDKPTPTYVNLSNLATQDWVGKAAMPFLCNTAKYMVTTEISGRNRRYNYPVADILQCPMSNTKKERLKSEQAKRTLQFQHNMREYYVLTLEEMRRNDYPIPPFLDPEHATLPDGWKETHPSLTAPTDNIKKIIAVDCEMVMTEAGSSLARVTLIDEDGSELMDELVKPDSPIVDYLTKYSGITPAAMSMATCSLRRAQKHFRKLVDHNTILVGHSLENDLNALQIAHPYCVDTSLMYDHIRGPPYKPSLRHLTRTCLKRHIQDRNDAYIGHDSAEDARATLDLFKLKLANKPSFGRIKMAELVMDRLAANKPPMRSAIIESSRGNMERSFGSTSGSDYFRVDTDEKLVDMTLEKANKDGVNFLFTRYQVADEDVERKEKSVEEDSALPSVLPSAARDMDEEERIKRLSLMDGYIRQVYMGLPNNSFVVVSGGVCDVPMYKILYDKFTTLNELHGDKGPQNLPKEDNELLCKYAAQARTSSSFIMFKS